MSPHKKGSSPTDLVCLIIKNRVMTMNVWYHSGEDVESVFDVNVEVEFQEEVVQIKTEFSFCFAVLVKHGDQTRPSLTELI